MADTILSIMSAIGELGQKVISFILSFLFDILEKFIHLLFDWINIPSFPDTLRNSINSFLDLIFNNLSFLGFFIRPSTLKIIIPLLLILINFKYIYKISMWIIRKIPFLNVR